MRDIKALTASLASPAVQLLALDAASRSHFGGDPELPAAVSWPEWKGRRLAFLARVSLAELHAVHRVSWLPATGALLFFYDAEEQPWGFDPKDRGCCAVLHVDDLPSPVAKASGPVRESFIARTCIGFRRIDTLPSWERDPIREFEMTDEESDEYSQLADAAFLGMPKHQIAGLPSPVQGDQMDLECQLASNGLYCGDGSGYKDPRAKALEPGAAAWRLLFQFDSDDDLGVMWGDIGMLYFWVKGDEAAAGNFRNAWLILQCS